MKVAVVGGGPAGLTTLKFLATAHTFFPIPPLQVRLFESEDDIGGTFVHRVYEDAEVSSAQHPCLRIQATETGCKQVGLFKIPHGLFRFPYPKRRTRFHHATSLCAISPKLHCAFQPPTIHSHQLAHHTYNASEDIPLFILLSLVNFSRTAEAAATCN